MEPEFSMAEALAYATIRIECQYKGSNSGTGTGFFVAFHMNKETGDHVPVIITNKHVIRDSMFGKLTFTKADKTGKPIDKEHIIFSSHSFEQLWTLHPDPEVDLCAMPIARILLSERNKGIELSINTLPLDIIARGYTGGVTDLDAIEDVLMIGYPNGLWDNINNQPIFRRGITATHPLKDYLGKKEFVIDAACFPGSSGSPVFIYNSGGYTTKKGSNIVMGSRLILLGILYAGPQMTITGDIVVVDIPTVQTPMSVSKTMINLGYVIKAERILELEKLIR